MKINNNSKTTHTMRAVLLLTILFTLTPFVSAQEESAAGGAFSSITDLIQGLAIGIGEIVTLGGVPDSAEPTVLSGIFFIFVFTAFFMAGQLVFVKGDRYTDNNKEGRKYAGIFAALIALTATIMVPPAFILSFSGTLTLLIMSMMFLAVIALPLYVMYSFVPDILNDNDTVVGMTKVLLSIVTIFTIGLYTELLNGIDTAPQSVASQGIGGAFGQVIVDIIGTLTGLVLLIFVVTFILGIKQAWPKSKKKKTSNKSSWVDSFVASDEDVINKEITSTIKDLDNVRQGQLPVQERVSDYITDARKELNDPTGGSLTKIIGYLNNILEDVNGQDRQQTLLGEVKQQKNKWEAHKENLKKDKARIKGLIADINELIEEAQKDLKPQEDKAILDSKNELLARMHNTTDSLQKYLDDFSQAYVKKAKNAAEKYNLLFSELKTFEDLEEELDSFESIDMSRIDEDFSKIEKDAKEIEKRAMKTVANLGDKARNKDLDKNKPRARKEIENTVTKLESLIRDFKQDFDDLRKDITTVEDVLSQTV